MSLKIIYGLQQDDVTGEMYQQIGHAYQQSPEKQFICLVPNHIKFSSEVQILQAIGAADPQTTSKGIIASSRLQILSFSRLLWYFLRDDPYYQQPQLTKASQAMLLSELLDRERAHFPIFYGERRRMGFLEQLGDQLTELAQGDFSPATLDQAAEKLATQGVPRSTTAKLQELSRIYQLYQTEITSNFVTNEQLLHYLIQQVQQRDFSQYEFFISGFSEFDQQQLALIRTLLQQQATIYLTLYLPTSGERLPYYFASSWRILKQLGYDGLTDFAAADLFPAPNKRISAELQQVEDFWIASNAGQTSQSRQRLSQPNLQVWQADSLTSEVRGVVNYLRQLVALQGYRYRDFLVLAEDLNSYSATIESLFRQNDVPFFSDQQTPMANHPFVVFIRSLLALSQGNFQLTDLFVLLRTELWRPDGQSLADFRQQLDWLENYALAFGLRSYHWLNTTPWQATGPYVKQAQQPATKLTPEQAVQQAAIESLHRFYGQALQQWRTTVAQVTDSADFASELFHFLKKIGVIQQLQQWEQDAVEHADLILAQRPKQTYQAFIALLDDYVQVWGTTPFDLNLFTDLLNAGFNNTEFAQIPATLDAVLVSKLGMVQTQTHRITIILGATRQNLPALSQGQQLIDDQERSLLNRLYSEPGDPQLRQASVESSADLPLRYGNIFFSSSQRLIFTYPAFNDQQGAQELSPYVIRLQDHFQLGDPAYLTDHPQLEPQRSQPALSYAASRAGVIGPLLLLAREAQTKKQPLPADWQAIADLLLTGEASSFYRRLWQSLTYHNVATDLSPENVALIYGDHLFSSVSQLESYYTNPYEFFLKYGLRLRPRQQFALNSADTGTYFHDYLDHFLKAVATIGQPLDQLSKADLLTITKQIQQTLANDPAYQLLNGPGQMHYFAKRLAQTSAFMANVIQKQAAHSFLYPAKTEIQFGQIEGDGQLPALEFTLPGKQKLSVRGKIDRLDVGQWGSDWYYQIIDYKSGLKKFDYTRVYYGLSLQLLTYLQSIQNNRQVLALPAATSLGAFYLHLSEQKMAYKSGLDDPNKLLLQILDDHRYNGILLENTESQAKDQTPEGHQNNQDFLAALDPASQNKKSSLYPRGYSKKNGYSVTAGNSFPRPQLPELLAYNRFLLQQAATEIFSGALRIAPYRIGADETGLQYSDFKAIMMFDAMLPENRYRQLLTIDKTDFLAKLAEFTQKQAEGQAHLHD
ncbi:PD-(D/E)XK nuclease family protein [Lapidilactobacillus luobeiensis]|uniref:PD-(D/E)XK nuclease family protein n=1 Tax=Lapidilactobacillus luobeiensis TaxID=2950371 RepID=UPI0021C3917C|nr:PD-(D/E)XK nuclease family protein [Lapidilactobacillus luobeiensis]